MLNDTQKELILKLAKKNGYQKWANGKFVTSSGSTSLAGRFLQNINFPEALWSHSTELESVLKSFDSYSTEIVSFLRNAEKVEATPLPTIDTYVPGDSDNIANLVPLINIERRKGDPLILLYNPENHKVLPKMDIQYYLTKVNRKELEIVGDSEILSVVTVFDPFSIEPFIYKMHDGLNRKIAHLNLYTPPRWQRTPVAAKYGGFIKTLIEHLFPIELEREAVLDWLHYALTRRNGTILCLAGPRGTGKSLLMSIISYLVGLEYSEIGNKELLAKNFNSAFKNKRLVVFEEVEVSDSTSLNKLKALANSRITLEEKGKDSETIDNYTSMAILLNDVSQLKIAPQDRRFSAPKVAEHDLRKTIPEIEIQNFSDNLEGEEVFQEVAEFGQFLIARKPVNSNMYAIKGDYYYFLCSLALSEWKNFIIRYISNWGRYDVPLKISKMSADFKVSHPPVDGGKGLRFPDKSETFDEFLKDYKHRGEYYIGEVVKSYESGREVFSITPNSDFLDYIEKQRVVPGKVKADRTKTARQLMDEADAIGAL